MSCLNFPPTELWPLRAAIGRNVAAVRWARGQRVGDVVVLSDDGAARAAAAAAAAEHCWQAAAATAAV